MKKAFGARRVPRKVGQDDDEGRWSNTQQEDSGMYLDAHVLWPKRSTRFRQRRVTQEEEPRKADRRTQCRAFIILRESPPRKSGRSTKLQQRISGRASAIYPIHTSKLE